MYDKPSEQYSKIQSHGLLHPGRFLWARALPWSIMLGLALWVTYKSFKGVGIGLGLSGTGLPTALGVLAALALYLFSVRLIERRTADELGLRCSAARDRKRPTTMVSHFGFAVGTGTRYSNLSACGLKSAQDGACNL